MCLLMYFHCAPTQKGVATDGTSEWLLTYVGLVLVVDILPYVELFRVEGAGIEEVCIYVEIAVCIYTEGWLR